MGEKLLVYLQNNDDPASNFLADETIPYCKGIKAMNE
jgi:hypothetical protein